MPVIVAVLGILFLVMFDHYLREIRNELIRIGNVLIEIREELKK